METTFFLRSPLPPENTSMMQGSSSSQSESKERDMPRQRKKRKTKDHRVEAALSSTGSTSISHPNPSPGRAVLHPEVVPPQPVLATQSESGTPPSWLPLPADSNPVPLLPSVILPSLLQSTSVPSLLERLAFTPGSPLALAHAQAQAARDLEISRSSAMPSTLATTNPLVQQWITNQLIQELLGLPMSAQNQLPMLGQGSPLTMTGPVLPPVPRQGHTIDPLRITSFGSGTIPEIQTSAARGLSSVQQLSGMDTAVGGSTPANNVEFHREQVARTGNTLSDSIALSLPMDKVNLSEFQCLVRDQIHLFAATQVDIDSSAQGRNRPIVLRQVGIRCRHCAKLSSTQRPRGAVYFPSKLSGLYQAAQNMTLNHFLTTCQCMPESLKSRLLDLKKRRTYVLGGGKSYWARGGRIKKIIEIDGRLFFEHQVPDDLKDNLNRSNDAQEDESLG